MALDQIPALGDIIHELCVLLDQNDISPNLDLHDSKNKTNILSEIKKKWTSIDATSQRTL